jgi:hypothetical protein
MTASMTPSLGSRVDPIVVRATAPHERRDRPTAVPRRSDPPTSPAATLARLTTDRTALLWRARYGPQSVRVWSHLPDVLGHLLLGA